MNKAIAIAFIVLSVFAFGIATAVSLPTTIAAEYPPCGGPAQPTCPSYCEEHPLDPICSK